MTNRLKIPFWLLAAVTFVIIAALFIRVWGASWQTNIALLLIAANAIPHIIKQTPRLYFAWMRLRYRITNVTTTWALEVRLTGDFRPQDVEAFARNLASVRGTQSRIIDVSKERMMMHYGGLFTIEFLVSPPDPMEQSNVDYNTLTVSSLEQQISYRRSTTTMQDTLIPLIEKLQKSFPSTDALYSLRIRFDGFNPFFGLYVQQMPPELITSFQCEFHLPSAEAREYVRVGKDSLFVVSHSLDRFRQAVTSGLTFSVAG